jgi:hypothetical protein
MAVNKCPLAGIRQETRSKTCLNSLGCSGDAMAGHGSHQGCPWNSDSTPLFCSDPELLPQRIGVAAGLQDPIRM